MGIQHYDIHGADARGRLGSRKEGRSSKKGSGHVSVGAAKILGWMGGVRVCYQGEWRLIDKEPKPKLKALLS